MFSSRNKRGAGSGAIPRYPGRKLLALVAGLVVAAVGFQLAKGRVIEVPDGDTLVVHTGMGKTDRVRLYGIDAPELGQRGGDEARAFARDLLLYSPVSLSVINTDQYGRDVALVRLEDGRIANEELVRAGRAWVYRDYCREAFCAQWLALEHQARKQGLGLWRQGKATPPWQWRKANPRR